MVGVAMGVAVGVDVAAPLLELAVATYAIGEYAVELLLPADAQEGVGIKLGGGAYGFRENLTGHGVGIGGAGVDGAVFGGIGWRG